MITVLIFGHTLRQCVDEPEIQCEVPDPATVRGLLEANRDSLGKLLPFMGKGEVLVTVNKKVGGLDTKVGDGDTVKLTHQFHPTLDGATWHNP